MNLLNTDVCAAAESADEQPPSNVVLLLKQKLAMTHFTTLTEAMQDLHGRGYTEEFAPEKDHLKVTSQDEVRYRSDDFKVDEFHRFEGTSDPGDEMTLYAISCNNGAKGLFVSAQGTYANEVSAELMAKFNVSDRANVNTEGSVQPILPSDNQM